ncbi:hypothetical protein [Endozoicomonas lisbonensis]|uniref:hypothetical protein n=1 Tax=Endozoicomonas lisbonensis TaxID=3120522 RepID=UPI00339AE7F8
MIVLLSAFLTLLTRSSALLTTTAFSNDDWVPAAFGLLKKLLQLVLAASLLSIWLHGLFLVTGVVETTAEVLFKGDWVVVIEGDGGVVVSGLSAP